MNAAEDYSGALGLNFWDMDPLAPKLFGSRLPPKTRGRTLDHLSRTGELCGGRLGRLIEAAHREERLPKLQRYDRWGARIDEVLYCPEQLEARRLVLAQDPLPPTPLLERMALAYLFNQNGEGGVTCPLAMTDGLAALLQSRGTPEQKRRYMPVISDLDGPTPLTGGQFATEKQSGTNLSENETRAVQAPDGTWRLTGLKWFCSNPGELWVASAKPEGQEHIALFLMPRRLPDGSLNECHILRLKEITGSRGKATAEVEFKGAYAELIGRPSHGLAILLQTVLRTSRIHVAAGSLGMARRALLEAELFAQVRKAQGRPIAALPHVARSLERMRARWAAGLLCYVEELCLIEKEDPAAEVLVPLMKVQASRLGTWTVRQAQLIFAGHGILRDFSILPRLADDAFIQEIWEGTHGVLAGHAAKALRRPASREAFLSLIDACAKSAAKRREAAEGLALLGGLREDLAALLKRLAEAGPEERDARSLELCDAAYRCLALALRLREAGGGLEAAGALGRAQDLAEPLAF